MEQHHQHVRAYGELTRLASGAHQHNACGLCKRQTFNVNHTGRWVTILISIHSFIQFHFSSFLPSFFYFHCPKLKTLSLSLFLSVKTPNYRTKFQSSHSQNQTASKNWSNRRVLSWLTALIRSKIFAWSVKLWIRAVILKFWVWIGLDRILELGESLWEIRVFYFIL